METANFVNKFAFSLTAEFAHWFFDLITPIHVFYMKLSVYPFNKLMLILKK